MVRGDCLPKLQLLAGLSKNPDSYPGNPTKRNTLVFLLPWKEKCK